MKKKLLAAVLSVVMLMSLLPGAAFAAVNSIQDTDDYFDEETAKFRTKSGYWADVVTAQPNDYVVEETTKNITISSPEALAWFGKQVNQGTSFAGYTITIDKDIDMSAYYWTPIDTATIQYSTDGNGKVSWTTVSPQKKLDGVTITGGEVGHTITGITTSTGLRGPAQPSEPGDGQNCYYYSAFIARNDGELLIENLNFADASIAITEPAEGVSSNGTSMTAAVVAINTGNLTIKSVEVTNAKIFAMQKAAAFLGMLSSGTFTVENCAVIGCDIKAYFQVAPICGYVPNSQYSATESNRKTQFNINGVKLENNTISIVEQQGENWTYKHLDDGSVFYFYKPWNEWDIGASEFANLDESNYTYEISGETYCGTVLPLVAEIDGYKYATLEDAFNAAADGETVKLLTDIYLTKTVKIDQGKEISLDLAGKAITVQQTDGRSLYAIDNYGTLTLKDSIGTGSITARGVENFGTMYIESGTINSCDSNGGGAAVWNEGTLVVTGGKLAFTGQQSGNNAGVPLTNAKTTATATISGGTLQSPYTNVMVNAGVVNITGGATLSGVQTAYWNAVKVASGGTVDLKDVSIRSIKGGCIEIAGGTGTLTNCTFEQREGADHNSSAVSVSNGGTLSVYSSKYTASLYGAYVFNSGGTIHIYGGSFSATSAVLKADKSTNDSNPSVIYVHGGEFDGTYGIANGATLSIDGGYFTSDPGAYVIDGKVAVGSDKAGYTYMVGEKQSETDVKPATGDPEVNTKGIDEDHREQVLAAASDIAASGLEAYASTAANAITDEDANKAVEALKSDENVNTDGNTQIYVYAQAYLNITPTAYTPAGENIAPMLELEIVPMYRLVASTAGKAEEIILSDEQGKQNAIILENSEQELNVNGQTEITIPLPNGFISNPAPGTIFVTHVKDNGEKFVYTAKVTENPAGSYAASFVNPNGFSVFRLSLNVEAAIGDTYYETLQDAVNAVKDNETITLLADGSATVSRTVTFKIQNESGKNYTATITAGTRTTVTESTSDSGTTYTCVRSSGGSGSGTTTYPVTTPNTVTNGSVTVSPKSAAKNATVTLTVTPDEGYRLDKLTVTDKDGNVLALTDQGNGKYTFVMPASKVDVSAAFAKIPETHVCPSAHFTDISTSQWYHEAVDYVVEAGMMNGTAPTLFEPDGTTTRGMIVTILYRLEGSPAVTAANPFTDVAAGQWYSDAVIWAAANGVVTGDTPTTFSPDDPITREQMAAILYRYAAGKGYDVTAQADLTGYADGAQISPYAETPMAWANAEGLITGTTPTTLSPQGNALRAQVAAILMRFCQNVAQ